MEARRTVFPVRLAGGELQRVSHHFWRYSWTVTVCWTKRHGEAPVITGLRYWYALLAYGERHPSLARLWYRKPTQ